MRFYTIITKNKKINTNFKKLQKSNIKIQKTQKNSVSFTKHIWIDMTKKWEII